MHTSKETPGPAKAEGQNHFVFSPADYNTDAATGVDYGKTLTPAELSEMRTVINAYIDGVIDENLDPFEVALVTPTAAEIADGCPDLGPGCRLFQVTHFQDAEDGCLRSVFLVGAIGDDRSTLLGFRESELAEAFTDIHAMVKRFIASGEVSRTDHQWLNQYSWSLTYARNAHETWQRIRPEDQLFGSWIVRLERWSA